VCVTELAALHAEQNERAWRVGSDAAEGSPIGRWEAWARQWEQRVTDLGDRCHLDVAAPDPHGYAGRRELTAARDAVLAVHRAYRAQVERFGLEEAMLARGAAEALEKARAAVARPPERR
jgi:hypothetical protein